jgi:hypothetical protein
MFEKLAAAVAVLLYADKRKYVLLTILYVARQLSKTKSTGSNVVIF